MLRIGVLGRHLGVGVCPGIVTEATGAATTDADLVIRGASIVDGTGATSFIGDAAVRGGLIIYVGPAWVGSAAETVLARGRTLTPGFIDIHT